MTIPYRQHVFTQDDIFTIAHTPPNGYFDVILVGGGAAGTNADSYISSMVPGGAGGQVVYKRVYVNSPRNYVITIGQGGKPAVPMSSYNGIATTMSDIGTALGGVYQSKYPVPPASQIESLDSTLGTLITNGLFSDNTTYYGGNGASIWHVTSGSSITSYGKDAFEGGAGGVYPTTVISSTPWNGSFVDYIYNGLDGQANTGGGGGAAANRGPSYDQYTYDGVPGTGGSGIVIIRYPILI